MAAVAPNLVWVCVALLLTGVAGFAFVTLASTTVQLPADPEMRGRVMALWVFVYIGTTPLGSIIAGRLSATHGPRSVLWLGAAACALAAFIAARAATPPHRDRRSKP